MNKQVIEHEIKLDKPVKIILGALVLGVFLNAFAIWNGLSNLYVYLDGSIDVGVMQ